MLGDVMKAVAAVNQTVIQRECGRDSKWINETFLELVRRVSTLQMNTDAAIDLTSCQRIVPLLKQVTYGTTCAESAERLAFLFAMMVVVSVLCMILFSARAALFNPLIRAKRKKRREKEFREYKKYMSQYYNTADWKLDPNDLQQILGSPPSNESTVKSSYGSEVEDDEDASQASAEFRTRLQSQDEDDEDWAPQGDKRKDPVDIEPEAPEIEVIYYSSDSDSEDEISLAQSINSRLYDIVANIKTRTPRRPRPSAPPASQDIVHRGPISPLSAAGLASVNSGVAKIAARRAKYKNAIDDGSAASVNSMVHRFFRNVKKRSQMNARRKELEYIERNLDVNDVGCPACDENPRVVLNKDVRTRCRDDTSLGIVGLTPCGPEPHKILQETPRKKKDLKDPLSLGYCHNSILSDNSNDDEDLLAPLSPQPKAPRKRLVNIPRTNGASRQYPY